MKKLSKCIYLGLILFLIGITNVFATKTDLKTLGEMVVETNASTSFYVIGDYVFTSSYVSRESLNLQDIMLAARSIHLDGGDGELKSTSAYGKMSIHSASAIQDKTGAITGWEFGTNLVGSTNLANEEILNIKYIDYTPVEEVYVVTFKDDKDSEIEKQYVINNHSASSPKLDDKVGYDFVGWFKCTSAEDCSNVEDSHDKFDLKTNAITGDITLKAKWEIHKYNVTFDKDGGEGNIENQKVAYNTNASSPSEVIKTGYDFKGWFKCTSLDDCSNIEKENESFKFESTPITEDIKLKAKWEIHKYSVTFDLGSGKGEVNNQEVPYKEFASMPKSNPNREGYEFLGWFECNAPGDCSNVQDIIDGAEPGTSFNFESTEITKDIELKAKWKQIKRKVIFKAKIDEQEQSDVLDKTEITLTYPFKLDNNQLPKIKESEGYDFIKWTKNGVTIDGITNHIFTDEESTIVGEWKTKSFTITFKKDDNSIYREFALKYKNSIPDDAFVDLDKPSNQLYNSFKFKGWYKCDDANCGTIADTVFDFKQDGQEVKENMTFIAKYEQLVNTSEIMSNFTEQLKSDDFSAFVSAKNITLNILKKDTNLQTNFNKLVTAMKNIIAVNNVTKVEIGYEGETKALDSDNANQELTQLITTLSGENDLANSTINKLDGKTFTLKLTLTEGIKSQENDLENNSVTYTVKFNTEGFVYANSAEDLVRELAGDEEIIIGKDFDIPNKITIDKNVVIDGNDKTLTSKITGEKYTFEITSGNVTIKDLILKIDTLLPSEYDKKTQASKGNVKNTIGFKVGSAASLMITNVKVDGSKTIDRDKLTITRTGESISQVENYNSTNVVINENAAIELEGTLSGSGLTYTSEIYGSPAVLSKVSDEIETAHMNLGKMNRQTYIFNITERKNTAKEGHDIYDRVKNYVHYYGSYDNSYVTSVLYIYGRNMNPFFYLHNETLIEPLVFQDGGDFNMNEEGEKFNGWFISSGRVSSEELVTRKITNSNGINAVAQYSK